jgi:hypothetical protein
MLTPTLSLSLDDEGEGKISSLSRWERDRNLERARMKCWRTKNHQKIFRLQYTRRRYGIIEN